MTTTHRTDDEEGRAVNGEWRILHRYRTPIDPNYGGPTSTVTLWLDNLGGLMLGMDSRDGEKVIVIPIPRDEAQDFAAALHARADGTR